MDWIEVESIKGIAFQHLVEIALSDRDGCISIVSTSNIIKIPLHTGDAKEIFKDICLHNKLKWIIPDNMGLTDVTVKVNIKDNT